MTYGTTCSFRSSSKYVSVFPLNLGVLLEVVVGAVGDPLELAPADGEPVLDVHGALGVVGQLVLAVLAEPQVLGPDAVALVPGEALLDPVLVPVLVGRPARPPCPAG